MSNVLANKGVLRDLESPHGYKDYGRIETYGDGIVHQSRAFRLDVEREIIRNVFFFLGLHWIKFDTRYQTYRPMGLRKTTPRPVTNKIAAITEAVCSSLIGFKPPVTISPATQQGDDLSAALAGDKIRRIIEKEANLRRLKPLIAKWLTLAGSAFLINNYDVSPYSGLTSVQIDRCLNCGAEVSPDEIEDKEGACPECGADTGFEPAVHEASGEPITITVPRGRHFTEVKSPLECFMDYEVPFLDQSPYFVVSELQSREHLQKIYGQDEIKGVGDAHHGDSYSYYVQALAYTTGSSTRVLQAGGYRAQPRVRVRRVWIAPNDKAPDGIYAVIADTTVLESMPWRYHKENGDPFLNVVHMKYTNSPGRILGKSRISDVISKQEQRNRIESIIELHSRRMANAVWLVPHGVGLSKLTGEQGQLVRYNAQSGVPAPHRESGDAVPPYLVHWLAQIDQEMDDIVGTYEVGRGEAPRGVSAYAALQLLDERARQGQSGLFENWALGFLEWTRQNLDIWREYAEEDRYLSAGLGTWAVEKFSKAQFQGDIDLSIEVGENRPTTSIGRRAAIEQAISLGALNMADPMQAFQVLEALGVPELMEDHRIDLEQANKENDGFLEMAQGGEPVAPPAPWDNQGVHVVVHRRFYYSDHFKALPPPIQQVFIMHMTIHMEAMMAQMMGPQGGNGGKSEGGTDKKQLDKETQNAGPKKTSSPKGQKPAAK